MNKDNAIEVHHITKKFRLYLDKGGTLKDFSLFSKRRRFEDRQVLKDISFEVKKGEAIGLVGRNGCGKSTTLKMLSRIMYPDAGTIEMNGRVSSLIELGAGFHPDMTGRENIYINASIFGLTKKEIDDRLEDIIEFSELRDFMDNPVRTYSSGMYMRLAFSVAINVDADILLIDEILAVGDAGFQTKCFNKLREIKAQGTTIVIVSHALGQIEQICERSIWIEDGLIRMEGRPKDVHLEYIGGMNQEQAERESVRETKDGGKRYGNRQAEMQSIRMLNGAGTESTCFEPEDPLRIEVDYEVHKTVEDAVFGIGIYRADGVWCYGTNTAIEQFDPIRLSQDGHFAITLDRLSLVPGNYWIDLAIEERGGIPVDYFKKALRFDVTSTIGDVGVVRPPHRWEIS